MASGLSNSLGFRRDGLKDTELVHCDRLKILLFVGRYIPAFRAGGPIRSIGRLVDALGDELEFWIVTRDRDLGDNSPFETIEINRWNKVGKANVYYASPVNSISLTRRILREVQPDIVYLNSFFDLFSSIIPLVAIRWFRALNTLAQRPSILLAPRGEFSLGALALKRAKKQLFVALARATGLHRGVTLHVTAAHERTDVARVLPRNGQKYAKPIGTLPLSTGKALESYMPSGLGSVNVVFLSRISPMKNLEFALRAIALCKCAVRFDIYGPHEDEGYWKRCEDLVRQLPHNVEARILGPVDPARTTEIIAGYDLFFLPTLGENFGHVIAEALAGGTPVLLSDRTPWNQLAGKQLGWDLPLEAGVEPFARRIEEVAQRSSGERRDAKLRVLAVAPEFLGIKEAIEANRQLFFTEKSDQHRP